MSGAGPAFLANVRWEVTRWRRSRRGWLLAIPPVAGPIGSTIADLYLRVPSVATAEVLGLLITGGLGALIAVDLAALAIGEELGSREYLVTLSLPQSRVAAIAGRLTPAVAGPLAAFAAGAGLLFLVAPATVAPALSAPGPLFDPAHLAFATLALLFFLGAVSAAGAAVTRSAAQGLVTGVLAGVVVAALVGLQLFDRTVTGLTPLALALAGGISIVAAAIVYASVDA